MKKRIVLPILLKNGVGSGSFSEASVKTRMIYS